VAHCGRGGVASVKAPGLDFPEMVTLRPLAAHDEAFLHDLYASTRADELAPLGWSPAQQRAFTQMQYQAQRRSYLAQFPAAEHCIIQRAGADVGRLIVDRCGDMIRLIDISLLPEHRNVGLGSGLLRALQAEAVRAGKPVGLHVDEGNRARRLYERLGFVVTAESDFYLGMTWRPVAGMMG
jgi:ribosomal protein S18 acetylase RimI-like enzyme